MWSLFKWKKRNKNFKNIYAPQSGQVIDVENIKDSIFSKKILGDGVALIPENGEIFSPVDGEIILIANTKHAVGIKTKDGLKILIHMGIDTVELKGEGFESDIEFGNKVKQGDLLVKMDLNLLKEKKFNPVVIIVIENMEDVEELEKHKGYIKSKDNVILKYTLKRK